MLRHVDPARQPKAALPALPGAPPLPLAVSVGLEVSAGSPLPSQVREKAFRGGAAKAPPKVVQLRGADSPVLR